jgi:hypothetical protein
LEVDLIVQGIWGSKKSANGDCVEKKGAKGQLRATCKPSVASASILDHGNPLSINSIKALKTPKLDKDSWSFKGAVKGVDDPLEKLPPRICCRCGFDMSQSELPIFGFLNLAAITNNHS